MKLSRDIPSLEERLKHVEQRLRTFRIAGALCLLIVVGAVFYALRVHSVRADNAEQVLRVRGLIIEDAQGRPRMLLGAPVPKVTGRKRQDDATGLVIVAENGADRVRMGAPAPSPQVKGQMAQRLSSEAGLVFDDTEGNERGGFGVSDSGRGVLCLDYPASVSREAICMAVLPDQGFAGLVVNAGNGSESERAEMAVLKDGTSLLKLADTEGNERTMFLVQGVSPAHFLVIDPKTKSKTDVLAKWKP
jgi:hypothetical protein